MLPIEVNLTLRKSHTLRFEAWLKTASTPI